MKRKIVNVRNVTEILFHNDTHLTIIYSLPEISSFSLLNADIIACNVNEYRQKTWLEIIACPRMNQHEPLLPLRCSKVFRLYFHDGLTNDMIVHYCKNITDECLHKYSYLRTQKPMIVFVNPFSGPGNALKTYKEITLPILHEAKISVKLVITERAGQASEMVNQLQLDNYGGIIIVSGDGLVYEVINGLAKRPDAIEALKLPIGIIPGGSGNALAAECCFPYGTVCKVDFSLNASFVVAKPVIRNLRLIRVETMNHTLFSFVGVGWGFIADLDINSEKFRRMLGPARFNFGAMLQLLDFRRYRGKISFKMCSDATGDLTAGVDSTPESWINESYAGIENDESDNAGPVRMPRLDEPVPGDWRTIEADFSLVYVMYMGHLAAGTVYLPRLSRCFHDRRIFLTLVRSASVGRCALLRFLLALQQGEHLHLPCFEVYPVEAFRLERADEQSIVVVDGERVDFTGPLQGCVSSLSASMMTAHA